MSLLPFAPFGGLIPRLDSIALPPAAAQTAMNCRLTAGVLEAYKAPLQVYDTTQSNLGTIYRFGQSTNSDVDYWFTFSNIVDVVKGPIANDTTERTFYTGDGVPKFTNASLATAYKPYPAVWYRLGLPKPGFVPTTSVTGAYSPTAVAEDRAYIFTYVDRYGQESEPSDASDLLVFYPASTEVIPAHPDTTVIVGVAATIPAKTIDYPAQVVTVNFDVPVIGPTPPDLTGAYDQTDMVRRLYRLSTGTTGAANYLFVADIPVANKFFVDDVAPEDLGEVCPALNFSQLPDTALGLVGMANGMMAAHAVYDVFFCETFKPYAWPVEYQQTVDYPIVGLGAFGTSLAVLTTGFPYVMSGSDPSSITSQKLSLPYSCASKRSIRAALSGVVYAAPDGLVLIADAGVSVLTDALYTRREWAALNPASMLTAIWDERIFLWFDNRKDINGAFCTASGLGQAIGDTGAEQGVVLEGGVLTQIGVFATAAYTDPVTNSLFLLIGGKIYKWDAGVASSFTWHSRTVTLPMPNNFGWAQVLSDTYPLTMNVYQNEASLDGSGNTIESASMTLTTTRTVVSAVPFRLPGGFKSRYWEVELVGTGRVNSAFFANATDELQSV